MSEQIIGSYLLWAAVIACLFTVMIRLVGALAVHLKIEEIAQSNNDWDEVYGFNQICFILEEQRRIRIQNGNK